MRFIKKTISVMLVVLIAFACCFVTASAETVDFRTPTSTEQANLRFALKLGNSYRDAPSPPVFVDGYLVVMSGKTLYKIDAENGKIIKQAEMSETPSFSYTPVTYSDGVIYCPLDNGIVQAFDFKTLKSKWIYKDALGGQSLTGIVVSDNKAYTGFWNDETEKANYVCISTKDEDKKSTHEEKDALWTYTHKGGFYWAKSVVTGDYIIFGSDDGTVYDNKESSVFCFDKETGELADSLKIIGDQRSGITFDKDTSKIYFATKAGYLYSVKFSKGAFDDSSLKKLSLGGASTSTPAISDGRIYIGVQGESFGKGYLKIIDADNLKILHSVSMKGYPQNEVTLSVQDNKTFVYSTYNASPGGISIVDVSADKVSATDLFVPDEGMRNYCISPIEVSEDGTLFYKNDSGYIFAIENIENRIEENDFWSILKNIFENIVSFFISIFSFIGI